MAVDSDPLPPTEVRRPRGLWIEEAIAAAVMAALGLITLANVVVRYLTNYSFAFTEEYSIALMVVVTMLGSSIAAARNQHMRITWFVERMPRRWSLIANLIAMLATLAMFTLIIGLGARLVWDEFRFEVTSPGLGEPQWIYTLAMPALAVLVAIRSASHWAAHRRQKDIDTLPPPGAEI